MRPIAFLTATCVLEGHAGPAGDKAEHRREFDALQSGCAARDIDLQAVCWDDPELDPLAFAAHVIGTTWDYVDRPAKFLETLEHISECRPLLNPLPTVRWNLKKTYLRDLAAEGVPVVPTLWRASADAETVAAAFDELSIDEIVVKPEVGASAWRQARLRRGEPLPDVSELPPDRAMIQPFLPTILEEGEYSFLYFDREFSHCARKTPETGDYRIQSNFGGKEQAYSPTDPELALAARVVDAVHGPLLYARVDMIRTREGELALMELELVEPYLYPEQGPAMGERFAAALSRLLEESA